MESQVSHGGKFWPLSPRLWRRSNEYSKVMFEPRKPEKRFDRDASVNANVTPDLLRSRSFIRDRLEPLNLENDTLKKPSTVDLRKPPVRDAKRSEEIVKLRLRKQREQRPNSLQLLLCSNASGHYASNTWRYTRVGPTG